MAKVLLKTNKYNGKYVAIKSIIDSKVVGSGKNPATALRQASAKGFKDPVLVYVPKEGIVQIY